MFSRPSDGDDTARTVTYDPNASKAGAGVGGKAKRRLNQQVGAGRVLPRGAAEKDLQDNTKVKTVDKKGRKYARATPGVIGCASAAAHHSPVVRAVLMVADTTRARGLQRHVIGARRSAMPSSRASTDVGYGAGCNLCVLASTH